MGTQRRDAETMPLKILVVDDEPDLEALVRQRFRKQIRDREYEFAFAGNGVEALKRIADDADVEIVLTDIRMPEMDGLTLLMKLHELDKPALSSIIVSAYGDMENIRSAMNRGAFDFLTKPINLEDLNITVRKAAGWVESVKRSLAEHDQLLAVRQDLRVATRIQESILPRSFPPFPDRPEIEIHAAMIPAREVGGDFYDFFFIDHRRLGFVIGDVSGKGVPAAIFMAASRTLLKATALQVADPGECLGQVNRLLTAESDAYTFVTAVYGVLDTATGEVRCSSGGHDPPLLVRAAGEVEPMAARGGPVLGMIAGSVYEVAILSLGPGDGLLLSTDGVTEARGSDGEFFGNARLLSSVQRASRLPVKDQIDAVVADVQHFSAHEPQSDDITVLAVRFLTAPA